MLHVAWLVLTSLAGVDQLLAMFTGAVKKYFVDKGYGFISRDDGGDDSYIHITKCNDTESLNEGDKVSFDDIEYWSKSKQYMKMDAINCTVIGGGGGGGGGEGTMTGTVRMWREDKGFGFITPDDGGDDVFIHKTQCNDTESLFEGDQVSFDRDAPHWSKKKERYFRDGSNCTVIRGGPIRKRCGWQSVEDLI